MATYKVIQDIEAEDKFVGPLSLKQFVFAMAGAFFGWLSVVFGLKAPLMLIIFLPPALLGFFMAVPWSKDQPTELWVVAKLRFYFKPKKRLWNQTGLQELVTITAPKKIEKVLTKNFSQSEVKSRLKALAETIDSRGWAVKNTSQPIDDAGHTSRDDRLINSSQTPRDVPELTDEGIPDMLDTSCSMPSTNFDHMIEEKDQQRRDEAIEKMERIRNGEPLDNINQSPNNIVAPSEYIPDIKPYVPTQNDQELLSQLQEKKKSAREAVNRMHSIPASQEPQIEETYTMNESAEEGPEVQDTTSTTNPDSISTMTTAVRPDIIDLARNNDLNVATIARQAQQNNDNEVVVMLH